MTRAQWVEKNGELAAEVCRGTGIFPETLLAMAITESQRKKNGVYIPGESKLAKLYNNFFGIKYYSGFKGQKVKMTTREVYNDREEIIKDTFCVYPSKRAGFKGYIDFLKSQPRYKKVFKAPDYVTQIAAIASAGYATDPSYKEVVTNVAKNIRDIIPKVQTVANVMLPVLGLLTGFLVAEGTQKKDHADSRV